MPMECVDNRPVDMALGIRGPGKSGPRVQQRARASCVLIVMQVADANRATAHYIRVAIAFRPSISRHLGDQNGQGVGYSTITTRCSPLEARILRLTSLFLAAGLIVGTATPSRAAAQLAISARSALVLDGQGNVLYERNPNAKLPNASTTKVLTALVIIDSVALEDVVTVKADAAKEPPSKLGFKAGERFTVLELLYALMLISANDAAVALGDHVAGSREKFADLLNQKAKALGATSTHFVTSNGLPAEGHYTTARDLAIIMRAAMQNPIFVAIAQTHTVDLIWPGNHSPHRLVNHNKLLGTYATPVLGKTGFTYAAGRCYVGATQGTLLTVVMLGSQNLWKDARKLFDLGLRVPQLAIEAKGS